LKTHTSQANVLAFKGFAAATMEKHISLRTSAIVLSNADDNFDLILSGADDNLKVFHKNP